METDRNLVLGGLLAVLLVLTYVVLTAVVEAVIFAITVAYVLFPLRERLRRRGLSRRLASGLCTLVAFLAVLVVFVPGLYVIYRRRDEVVTILDSMPESVSLELGGIDYTVDLVAVQREVERVGQDIAVDVAIGAPALALAIALFTVVLYGVLYRPLAARDSVFGVVPEEYHDIIYRLHERTRTVLYALYLIQALTAIATFVLAFVLFVALGYPIPVWLAFFAAILQFIPMVGPTLLIVTLALLDVFFLDALVRGLAVFVLGLVFVALLPDVTIRPRLAHLTGEFSSTLYFVGFVGGLLTLGAIGIIVGPLVVALLVEVVQILSERETQERQADI